MTFKKLKTQVTESQYPRELRLRLREAYEAGASSTELAKAEGASVPTICAILRAAGTELRTRSEAAAMWHASRQAQAAGDDREHGAHDQARQG